MGWFDKLTTSWFDKLTAGRAHPTIFQSIASRYMLVLTIVTFFGFLISFTAHIFLLRHTSIPLYNIAKILSVGIIPLILARLFLTKNLRQGKNWFSVKSIKDMCPGSLKTITVAIFIYGIAMGIVNIIGMFSRVSTPMTKGNSGIDSRKLYIAVFSLLAACYILEFMLNFVFGILKELRPYDSKTLRGSGDFKETHKR